MNLPFNLPIDNEILSKGILLKRIFDLIRPKSDTYKSVFFRAFGNCLVTENLDIATKVAYSSNFRVATLSGELIELDGRMCAGGNKNRKSNKDRIDSSKLDEEKKVIESIQNEIDILRSQKHEISCDLQSHKNSLKLDESKLECSKLDIKNLTYQINEFENRLKKMNFENSVNHTESKAKEINDIEEKIIKYKYSRKHILKEVEIKEDTIRIYKERLKIIDDENIKEARENKENIRKRLIETRNGIEKCYLESENAKTGERKAQNELKRLQNEIDDLTKNQDQLNKKLDEIEEKATLKLQEKGKIEASVKKLRTEYRNLFKDKESFEQKISSLNLELIDLQDKIDNDEKKLLAIEDSLISNEQKIEVLKKKYSNLPPIYYLKFLAQLESTCKDKESIGFIQGTNFEFPNEILEDDSFFSLTVDEKQSIVPEITDLEICQINESELELSISHIQKEIQERDAVNFMILEQFQRVFYDLKEKQLALKSSLRLCEDVKESLNTLSCKRKSEFIEGFKIIALKLKELYQMLTRGGDAELELVDVSDPFNEGIMFSVRPPKKSWRKLMNLSGGEKTLSSLALIFAIHHYKPTPIYFLDEIDAALDIRNVSIIAQFIQEKSDDAQFIVISLRNQMFELCDRLIGVYKTYDITKSVYIDPRNFLNSKDCLDQNH